jgi:hypothetical protein
MAKLFISHSSSNNDKAIEVCEWLAANGWDDVFLDLDPKRGIVAGQHWKEELQKNAHRCEVVLALVSAEWLAATAGGARRLRGAPPGAGCLLATDAPPGPSGAPVSHGDIATPGPASAGFLCQARAATNRRGCGRRRLAISACGFL